MKRGEAETVVVPLASTLIVAQCLVRATLAWGEGCQQPRGVREGQRPRLTGLVCWTDWLCAESRNSPLVVV